MKIRGNPVSLARELASEGYRLIHIIDEARGRISPNLDIYDALTTFINIEVECDNHEFARRLLSIRSRIVVSMPPAFALDDLQENHRLIAGRVDSSYGGDCSLVHDLIVDSADNKSISGFSGKRIIISEQDYEMLSPESKKKVFGILLRNF
jgi:hypothetical protein